MTIVLKTPIKCSSVVNPFVRNNNTNTDFVKEAAGVVAIVKVGPGDYRMWYEGINNSDSSDGATNHIMYATSPDGMTWTPDAAHSPVVTPGLSAPDNGEICANCVLWNPDENLWFMYTHSGNNAGPRKSWLYTSPDLVNGGTWTRDATPMMIPDQTYEGTSLATSKQAASDMKVVRISTGNWKCLYRASVDASLSSIAYATSTDGRTWSKQGVVLGPAGSGWDNGNTSLEGQWIDATGRLHIFYVADSSGAVEKIGYAYSDDWTTWTRGASNPVISTGSSGAYDYSGAGAQVSTLDDGDILLISYGAFNLTNYPTNPPLRGDALAFTPLEVPTAPTVPGRFFYGTASRITWDAANTFMCANATWSLYAEFKGPTWRAASGGRGAIHTEYNQYNKLSMLYVKANGTLEFFYRDGTNVITLTSTATFDDNVWHRVLVRRISASSFAVYVDGTLILTSSATATTIADAMTACTGGTAPGATGDEPALMTIRRVIGISGYAMTSAEADAIYNSGTLPGSGTLKLNAKPGSGGTSGPDVDAALSTNGTVATGAILVNAQNPAIAPGAVGSAGEGQGASGTLGVGSSDVAITSGTAGEGQAAGGAASEGLGATATAGQGEKGAGTLAEKLSVTSATAGEGEKAAGTATEKLAATGTAGEAEKAAGTATEQLEASATAGEGERASGSVNETVTATGTAGEAEEAHGFTGTPPETIVATAGEGESASGTVTESMPATGTAAQGEGATGAVTEQIAATGTGAEAESASGALAESIAASGSAGEAQRAAGALTEQLPGAITVYRGIITARPRYSGVITARASYHGTITVQPSSQ